MVDDDEIFMVAARNVGVLRAAVANDGVCVNGERMLEHLNQFITSPEKLPDPILPDIAVPMDGWMFLDE